MTRQHRLDLIKEIEERRKSRVLVYITGDRQGLPTKIGMDTLPFIAQHLSEFGNVEKIDLILYSTGGITMAGYSLANLFREYCDKFGVLIPFKALSAATLVAMGADEIIMSRMGQLSPIDPSVSHALGPAITTGPNSVQILPVNVEDIFNYFDLARDELNIKDVDSLERVLESLSKQVHPLVLGHGYRLRQQIAFLARNLLATHITNEEHISTIIKNFTRGRFSHDYIFSRKEAKEVLKLPVINSPEIETLIVSLFKEYQLMLQLPNPFSPEIAIGDQNERKCTFDRAIIESINLTHVFRTERVFRRIQVPIENTTVTAPQIYDLNIHDGWIEDNDI